MAADSSNIDELFRRYGPSYRWLVTFTVMTGAIATRLTHYTFRGNRHRPGGFR